MTGCAHTTQPGPCSQCVGVVPRHVTHADGVVLVDGVQLRRYIPSEKKTLSYRKRKK